MSNRLIREDWFTDETLDALSNFEFRLYAAIHVKADDYGRFFANPKIIAGFCLPLRDEATFAAVRSAIDHMAELGLLQRYTVNGCQYLELCRWSGEQIIRNKHSKYPAPVEETASAVNSADAVEPVPSGDSGEQTRCSSMEIPSSVPAPEQIQDDRRETHCSVDPHWLTVPVRHPARSGFA